jgi:hypothetical protein
MSQLISKGNCKGAPISVNLTAKESNGKYFHPISIIAKRGFKLSVNLDVQLP